MNRLFGRDGDLLALNKLLEGGARWVTLVGPGGVGKSTLAHAVVAGREHVVACTCEHVRDTTGLLEEIARAAGLEAQITVTPHEVARGVRARGIRLVVVDECEHLDRGAAEAVEELLSLAPQLQILATSRHALERPSEQAYALEPIVDAPAARAIFEQKVRTFSPTFAPSPDDVRRIETLCTLLEGNPLALELAAPSLQLMTLTELVERLSSGRKLPADPSRPDKHRSMRVVIDASLARLSKNEAEALLHLCTFVRPFDADAAEAVLPDGIDSSVLLALRRQSLLRAPGLDGRIAVYASAREVVLATAEPSALFAARERHAQLLAERARRLRARPSEDLQRIRETSAELVAAMDHCVALATPSGDERAFELAWSMFLMSRWGGMSENGERYVRTLLARGALAGVLGETGARRTLLSVLATRDKGDLDEAKRAIESLESEAPAPRAMLYIVLSRFFRGVARFGESFDCITRAVALSAGDEVLHARCKTEELAALDRNGYRAAGYEQRLCKHFDALRLTGSSRTYLFGMVPGIGPLADASPELGRRYATDLVRLARELGHLRAEAFARMVVLQCDMASGVALSDSLGEVAQLMNAIHSPADATMLRAEGAFHALGRGEIDEARRRLLEARRGPAFLDARALLDCIEARLAARDGVRFVPESPIPLGDLEPDVATVVAVERALCEMLLAPAASAEEHRPRLLALLEEERKQAPLSMLVRAHSFSVRDVLAQTGVARSSSPTWRVSKDGAWIERPDGERVSLGGKRALRSVVRVMVEAHHRERGAFVPSKELAAAAWPDEKLVASSARDRPRTSIARLRKMGLAELLESSQAGYRVVPDAEVVWASDEPPRRRSGT